MKRAPPPPPTRKNPLPPPPSRAPRPPINEISQASQQPQPETNNEQLREPQRPQNLGIPDSTIVAQPQPVTITQKEADINKGTTLQEENLEQPQMEQELGQPNHQNIEAQKEISFPAKSMIPPKMAPPPNRGKLPVPKTRGMPPPPPAPKITSEHTGTVRESGKQEDSNIVTEKKQQEHLLDAQLNQKATQLSSDNTAVQPSNPLPLPPRKNVQVPPPLKSSPKSKVPPPTFNSTFPKLVQNERDEISEDISKHQEQEINALSTPLHQQQPNKPQLIEQKPLSSSMQTNEDAIPNEDKANSRANNPLLQKLKRLQKAKEEMTKQHGTNIQGGHQSENKPQKQEINSSSIEKVETVEVQTSSMVATALPKLQQKAVVINRKVPAPPPSIIKNPPPRSISEPIVEQQPVPERKQPVQPPQVEALKIVPEDSSSVQVTYPNPPPKSPMLIQINSLLERYHNVKAFYLSNLKELDEQLNFHRQQEEAEVEKINHLIAELSKKNEKIKELCQISSSNNSLEDEQLQEAAV